MGRKVALLVGVGTYGSGLKPLQCPANGVAELQAVLENPEIGGFDEVVPLVDPDVGMMRSRIGEVFSRLTKQDLVLFYFTGHGIKDMTGAFYLTTSQTHLFDNGNLNPGTAVEADFLKRVLGNCYAQRKVIILDCCFGAAFGEGFLTMDDGRMDVEADLGGEGWVVLTAATARNYALEQEGESLSVYTRYLVEGLKSGAAANEGEQTITVRQLHGYVREQVRIAAPTMEPSMFNGHQGDEIALARAVINPELIYRQKVKTKIRRGRIAPAVRQFLQDWRVRLGISPERAAEIEAEVLKPFAEKQKHVERYAQTLREEIEEEFPLSLEAVRDLKELQKLWNLPDGDVTPILKNIAKELGVEQSQIDCTSNLAQTPQTQMPLMSNYDSLNSALSVKPPPKAKSPTYSTFSFEVVTIERVEKSFFGLGQPKVITGSRSVEVEYRTEDLGNGVKLELVRIPSGRFQMGAPEDERSSYDNERPQHWVTVSEFWMGKFPVTQAQYQAVMGENPSHFSENGANRPVERVSWHDAVAFCEKLTQQTGQAYRLPSEAEWEYACRAGTETPFHFGTTITTDLANYDGNSTYGSAPQGQYREQTTEVGSFPANAFGLYDMHGNVLEWCQDHWHENYVGAPEDGSAWIEGGDFNLRVRRGGSWYFNPWYCRSASRSRLDADYHYDSVGFRVVCSAPRILP